MPKLPQRVVYAALTPKQQEIYNFQKVAAHLADFGFNCIKLADDWQGADFLAYHSGDSHTRKVQLKGRLHISKKYVGKSLDIAFPIAGIWHLIDHDALVELCGQYTRWLTRASWTDAGEYHSAKPNSALRAALKPYALNSAT